MFRLGRIGQLDQLFSPLSARENRAIFFYRISTCSDEILQFIKKYYEEARRNGVIIDGRIPNPTPQNLDYFFEMMGQAFRPDQAFLDQSLQKWLPRMSQQQRASVTEAMYSTFQDMKRDGKNDNMLKNAYTKYMCWLYYKFERIVNKLGADSPPKILYDGEISHYELQLLTVLSRAGADIVLLERNGDGNYLQLDPRSELSMLYEAGGTARFPDDFSLKWVQEELVKDVNRNRLYGPLPTIHPCTNAWMKRASAQEILTPVQSRGTESQFFYNSFIVQYGVEDKLTCSSDLFSFYKQLKNETRKICVVNGSIPTPTPEEVSQIKRSNYSNVEQLLSDLTRNIQYTANVELERLMRKSFIDVILDENKQLSGNILKLTNKAVYLLCWLKRYQKELFSNWKLPEVSVFILFGTCASDHEAMFLTFLSQLPVDAFVLVPDLNAGCSLSSSNVLEIRYECSAPIHSFPTEHAQIRVSTSAYQAERELDSLLYQDSGLYRNQQYGKAESVTLQTMYEEIALLWDQELKYRPSFSTDNQVVVVPVLLEKICGVKDGSTAQYWYDIKKLITPDTLVIKGLPWIDPTHSNPIKPFATQFLQNKKLARSKIKAHQAYQYGILRPDVQDHILDQLQVLLDRKTIVGTYENGTEYTIISTVLNLDQEILRMIQRFDFTKKNPKLIFINTTEKTLSLEESILVAFLNLVGFDILFFVPTGYQCIEKYFSGPLVNEQQIGEYMYDLPIPNFQTVHDPSRNPIRKLFGRSF